MKTAFTSHARAKLKTKDIKELEINRKKIIDAIKKPLTIDKSINPHRNTSKLSNILSLCVIWREDDGIIRVITFYPAEKGRYESKVLQRR